MRNCVAIIIAIALGTPAMAQPTITVRDADCERSTLEQCMVDGLGIFPSWTMAQKRKELDQRLKSNFDQSKAVLESCRARVSLSLCSRTVEAPITRAEMQAIMTAAIEKSNASNREEWHKIFQGMLDAGTVSVSKPPPN